MVYFILCHLPDLMKHHCCVYETCLGTASIKALSQSWSFLGTTHCMLKKSLYFLSREKERWHSSICHLSIFHSKYKHLLTLFFLIPVFPVLAKRIPCVLWSYKRCDTESSILGSLYILSMAWYMCACVCTQSLQLCPTL